MAAADSPITEQTASPQGVPCGDEMRTGGDLIRETFAGADAEHRERVLVFMESLYEDSTPFLRAQEEKALREGIPIIRPQTQRLIRFLLALRQPAKLLEIGTATGFSALYMLHYAPASATLLSMERDETRWREAKDNLHAAVVAGELDREERCSLELGDAAVLLPALKGTFDFIFLDAAKGQYLHFLPALVRLLTPGGILLSDNIFQDGEILESRYAVRRRDRTIHRRMRDYLFALTHSDQLETLLLQEGDGAAVSLKK